MKTTAFCKELKNHLEIRILIISYAVRGGSKTVKKEKIRTIGVEFRVGRWRQGWFKMAVAIVSIFAAHHSDRFLMLLVAALKDAAIVGVCSAPMCPHNCFVFVVEMQFGKTVAFVGCACVVVEVIVGAKLIALAQ